MNKHKLAVVALAMSGVVAVTFAGEPLESSVSYGDFDQSAIGEKVFAGPTANQQADEVYTLDVVFVTNEYDADKSPDDWLPISGVEYEVYTMGDDSTLVGRGVTDEQGIFTIKGLPEGNYTWTQTVVPDKYNPMIVDGEPDFGYFSIHPLDEDKIVYGTLDLRLPDDLPIINEDGHEVDEWGNRLDSDGNVIPEEVEPPVTSDKESEEKDSPWDENGSIIGDDGNLYDENGNLVNKDGHYIDEDGRLVDNNGHLVDKDGNWIDEEGYLVDEEGRRIDEDGYLVDVIVGDDETKGDYYDPDNPHLSDEDDNQVDDKANGKKDQSEANKDPQNSADDSKVDSTNKEKENTDENKEVSKGVSEDDPEHVQTYDGGVLSFVLLAIGSLVGFVVLGYQKRKV